MKLFAATTAGIVAGATGVLLAHRYVGAFLWWIFTTDVRHTR